MTLIAIKAHTPDGVNHYKVGDRFEMSASSARLLIASKFAKPADPEPGSPEDKKHYKRRDLRAEP